MKILHNLLKGVSLTGALFVFQACYGMPEPPLYEENGMAPMILSLKAADTGAPLEGIRIIGSTSKFGQYNQGTELGVTGADGRCSVNIPYRRNLDGPYLRFEDGKNSYIQKDTSLVDLREREIVVKLNPR